MRRSWPRKEKGDEISGGGSGECPGPKEEMGFCAGGTAAFEVKGLEMMLGWEKKAVTRTW